jgi:hypothetical protein
MRLPNRRTDIKYFLCVYVLLPVRARKGELGRLADGRSAFQCPGGLLPLLWHERIAAML